MICVYIDICYLCIFRFSVFNLKMKKINGDKALRNSHRNACSCFEPDKKMYCEACIATQVRNVITAQI